MAQDPDTRTGDPRIERSLDPTAVPGSDRTAAEPLRLAVLGAAPNPFRADTRIELSVPARTPATIRIFDAAGRRVLERSLGLLAEGTHEFAWDGRDDRGMPTASGVYFFRLETTDGRPSSRRVVRLR